MLEDLRAQGFVRVRIATEGSDKPARIVELDQTPALNKNQKHTIEVVVDRIKVNPAVKQRLTESFETALRLADGRDLTALAYVIDPDHEQYCGGLPLSEQARIIAGAVGGRGPNRDYLFATAEHLAALGIADADLTWLAAQVRAM